jgi:hypothetical protein
MPNVHTTREAWLSAIADALQGVFADCGAQMPRDHIRVTCGFPSHAATARKRRRIGECWSSVHSADGTFEIMVSPTLAEPERVAGVLAHELVHATVGVECGHKGPFRRLALAIGLEGKMTETSEGAAFKRMIAPILDSAGPYPHAALDVDASPEKSQSARLHKVECPECGYLCRVSRKWLDEIGPPHCPLHGAMEEADAASTPPTFQPRLAAAS